MRMSLSIKSQVFKYSILVVLFATPLCVMVNAESTRVFLDPPSQMVGAVGDSFMVNVTVADVSNLYGFGFKLYYDSSVMNGTQAAEGSFLKSGGQTTWSLVSFTDHYNSTHGLVWVNCFLIGNASGISGSGVLATIKFKSLAVATTPLDLANVQLSDRNANLIPHEDVDGLVTVVPEFTSLVAFLTLVAASLFGVLIRKRATQGLEFQLIASMLGGGR